MNQPKNLESVNLFWTGGWDSTFRLLQLVLQEKKEVYPYYIIDHLRKSTGIEVYTMGLIRESIQQNFPEAERFLHPTFYYNLEHIEPNTRISEAWNRINTHFHVGTQFEWLPRFCCQFEIDTIEVSLFKDTTGKYMSTFRRWYNSFIKQESLPESPHQKEIKDDISIIFEYYNFPLMSLGKTDMLEIAQQRGWMSVMLNTHFCHRPFVNIKPCGICIPCRQATSDGMGWRIPIFGKLNRFIYKCKTMIKHDLLNK